MSKHTAGPWRVTAAPEGRWIEVIGQHPTEAGWEEDVAQADGIANAARIVACVNALDGIEDPEAFVEAAKHITRELTDGILAHGLSSDQRELLFSLVWAAGGRR